MFGRSSSTTVTILLSSHCWRTLLNLVADQARQHQHQQHQQRRRLALQAVFIGLCRRLTAPSATPSYIAEPHFLQSYFSDRETILSTGFVEFYLPVFFCHGLRTVQITGESSFILPAPVDILGAHTQPPTSSLASPVLQRFSKHLGISHQQITEPMTHLYLSLAKT
ncbi:hypothetical protein CC80DRAFT_69423 [Byssothecium circinans]|uniref:Uncharacterized protein n=1 Tax=Byssothecium circinans TaxID=147558 RepID=A0A6A5U4R8_9PLEO|nr:hypothetical protein CC80DRAFT_69423 [Byssothecium circinans]